MAQSSEPKAAKPDPFRPLDDEARDLLAGLLLGKRQAVLSTLDPESEAPYAAMVAFAADPTEAQILLHLSDLAAHKRHLRASAACHVLIAEPDDGRREILAHGRVSLACRARIVDKSGEEFEAAKACYLEKNPKHAMMFQLGDFDLVALQPESGLLNAGFGRAHPLKPADIAAAIGV